MTEDELLDLLWDDEASEAGWSLSCSCHPEWRISLYIEKVMELYRAKLAGKEEAL